MTDRNFSAEQSATTPDPLLPRPPGWVIALIAGQPRLMNRCILETRFHPASIALPRSSCAAVGGRLSFWRLTMTVGVTFDIGSIAHWRPSAIRCTGSFLSTRNWKAVRPGKSASTANQFHRFDPRARCCSNKRSCIDSKIPARLPRCPRSC